MEQSLKIANFSMSTKLAVRAFVASAVFAGCFGLPSQAAPFTRYNLNFNTISGTGTLNGFIEVDTSSPSATSSSVGTAFPSWIGDLALNLTTGSGTTTYTKSNFDSFWWQPNNPGSVVWNASLIPQFLNINFGHADPDAPGITLTALASSLIGSPDEINKYELVSFFEAAPGPLPLLGAGSAFAFSRKLRRRQRKAIKLHSN
jgi:hypothetical protein